jgi:hypothetical protein
MQDTHILRRFRVYSLCDVPLTISVKSDLGEKVTFQLHNENLKGIVDLQAAIQNENFNQVLRLLACFSEFRFQGKHSFNFVYYSLFCFFLVLKSRIAIRRREPDWRVLNWTARNAGCCLMSSTWTIRPHIPLVCGKLSLTLPESYFFVFFTVLLWHRNRTKAGRAARRRCRKLTRTFRSAEP